MEILFRPIVVWPTKHTSNRERSRFKAGYNDTLRLLDRELANLRAARVVIQVALGERDIRIDGLPRSGSRPSHPGVILSFESKFGLLAYPCDRFTDWEDNLRAVALSLEHLRAVDRYGVTERGEQYQGWTALPAPEKNGLFSSKAEALAFMRDVARSSEGGWEDAYRRAVMVCHPDRGGDAEVFRKIQDAKEILENTNA